MARKGALSKKTFWPSTGDILENVEEGLSWECVRANNYFDESRGEKIRYGLLVAEPPADSGVEEKLIQAIHDRDDSPWLEDIAFIFRKAPNGYRKYAYNAATETWQET